MKLPIEQIKPNPNNPRTIKDQKFKQLVKSLKEFPVMLEKRPIMLDEDNIAIGGNMRYKAAVEAKFKEVPVEYFTREDAERNNKDTGQNKTYEEYRQEFIIKDNVSGGEWDWDLLANEWDADKLDDWGMDLPNGFNDEEVSEDEAPEVSADPPKSKLGEVYQLGRHRVMCGDSTVKENVELLMDGVKADMVFTDPPYNVSYDGGSKKREIIKNDSVDDFYIFLFEALSRLFENTKAGASFYITHADMERVNFTKAFVDAGGYLSSVIIWVKDNATFGRQDYFWKHEPILYGWNAKGSHKWLGDNKQDTIWDIDRPSRSDEHPTMKPLALIAKALNNSSKSEDVVLDTFLGSGSTLIACEQTDRICYGMELDPKYVDVIRMRYVKFINPDNWEAEWETMTPKVDGV